jgi:hypothetical protein
MDDFFRGIFGDDLGRVGFAIGILKNESRFRRCDGLAVGRRCKKKTAGTDESKMGGKGTGFRHKERDLSSIIAACATGF